VLRDAKAIGLPKRIDDCSTLSRLESHGSLFRKTLNDPQKAPANVSRIFSANKKLLTKAWTESEVEMTDEDESILPVSSSQQSARSSSF
jgi:hypothetical protein